MEPRLALRCRAARPTVRPSFACRTNHGRSAAMSEILVIAVVCLVAGVAAGALVVYLMRPRGTERDTETEQAFASLNTRLNDMATWLSRTHGQLQENVNQRLDAVTARLGESLQTSTKHTTDHLKQLHERLAVIDG